MAHHKSAIRQNRRSLRRASINKQNKSAIRSQVKKVREAIKNKDAEGARKLLPETFSTIDKIIKKGTVHPNQGARYKSRLTLQVARISQKPSK